MATPGGGRWRLPAEVVLRLEEVQKAIGRGPEIRHQPSQDRAMHCRYRTPNRNDPLSLTAAVLTMLAATIVAGFLPARTASRIDPMVALRYE